MKMERATQIADYDYNGRSYWEKIDPKTGINQIHVHHTKHRPTSSEAMVQAGFTSSRCRDEGVLEGELVHCLTAMDEPLTKADYFALMKRMRLIEERVEEGFHSLQDGMQQLLQASSGNAEWTVPQQQEQPWRENPTDKLNLEPSAESPGHAHSRPSIASAAGCEPGAPENPGLQEARQMAFEVKLSAITPSLTCLLQLFERYDLDGRCNLYDLCGRLRSCSCLPLIC